MTGESAGRDPVCSICGEQFDGEAELVRCLRCETPHHRDCWEFQGACAVYGCGSQRCTRARGPVLETSRLVIGSEADQPTTTFRLDAGGSRADVAHLALIIFPLLWLPAAVDGGWLCALNLLFIFFPLLLVVFQVRAVSVESDGLRVGYLMWSRFIPWRQIRELGHDLNGAYSLELVGGVCISLPGQPGELRELEAIVRRRLRQDASAPQAG